MAVLHFMVLNNLGQQLCIVQGTIINNLHTFVHDKKSQHAMTGKTAAFEFNDEDFMQRDENVFLNDAC